MVSRNVAEIIRQHVTLEVEGIDRMYLNAYVPGLQTEGGFVHFVRQAIFNPFRGRYTSQQAERIP